MKKIVLFAVTAAWLFAACSEDPILVENPGPDNRTIQFSNNMVDKITRASKEASSDGTGFDQGDVMGIYGFQTSADGSIVSMIFDNTPVTKVADHKWTYDQDRYWNAGSTYEFYGFYPQDVAHSFDNNTRMFKVTDFVVANDKDDQVDLMIAKKNETDPFNKVNMVFNHILSNVNFYFKVQDKFNNSGIASYEVVQFDVEGLYSKGSYEQTGMDANKAAVGSWTVDKNAFYDLAEVTSGSIVKGEKLPLADDLLILPQDIPDGAIVTLTYKTVYKDGTESVFGPKKFQLNKAFGTWRNTDVSEVVAKFEPNYRYNYYLAVNPSIKNDPTADFDGGEGGYDTPTGTVKTLDPDDPNNPTPGEIFWYVDVDNEDGDYNPDVDYPIIWKDIDGDGKEEGIADKNRDGKLDGNDKFDNDQVNYNGDPDDPTLNPDNLDVIRLDKDGDGVCDSELERDGLPTPPPVDDHNADWDGSQDGDDNLTGYVDVIDADDPDNPTPGEDFWFVDVDGDGEYDPDVDYPIIWKDIDGDGKEEGIVDYDRDGEVSDGDNIDGDHTDHNGNPDDPDLNPEGVDVIRIIDPNDPTNIIDLERDPKPDVPEGTVIDWNGSVDGDGIPSGYLEYDDKNDKDTYKVDVDGDGEGDYNIVWEDIDGDGKLEGVVDYDGDGKVSDGDNVDGDETDYNSHADGNDNPSHVDVILVDEDGDGFCESELEWPGKEPDIPERYGNADWDGGIDGYQNPQGNYVVNKENGFGYIDADGDGKYDPTIDYPILWKDIDGDGFEEGIVDYNRDGKLDANDQIDGDNRNYKGDTNNPVLNPDNLDVIMLDMDGDHVAEKELERKGPDIPKDDTVIEFSADVDEWIDEWDSETPLTGNNN